jgi:hypothetical protein
MESIVTPKTAAEAKAFAMLPTMRVLSKQKFHGLVPGHGQSISYTPPQLDDFTSSYAELETCV